MNIPDPSDRQSAKLLPWVMLLWLVALVALLSILHG
jgi:hypothetical protein